jgi:hypothetical protein
MDGSVPPVGAKERLRTMYLVGCMEERQWKWAEWGLAGPNRVLAFSSFFIFHFLFSLFKFNLNSNLIQTFCGSSLQIIFVKLGY